MDNNVVNPVVINEEMTQEEHNSGLSKTCVKEQKYLMSAALITDAKDGFLSLHSSSDFINVRIYFLYRHWLLQSVVYCAIFLHHFIILFEKSDKNSDKWKSLSVIIEFLCLLIYTIRLCHLLLFTPSQVFWSDKKNLIVASAILMTICDIIISFLVTGYVRWSPILRPLFIINFADNKQVINKTYFYKVY